MKTERVCVRTVRIWKCGFIFWACAATVSCKLVWIPVLVLHFTFRAAPSFCEVSTMELSKQISLFTLPFVHPALSLFRLTALDISVPACPTPAILPRWSVAVSKGTGIVMTALNSALGENTNRNPQLNSHSVLQEGLKQNRGWGKTHLEHKGGTKKQTQRQWLAWQELILATFV